MSGNRERQDNAKGDEPDYELERERQRRELEDEIRQRQVLVEVLPPICDADEAIATLDYVMDQLDRAQRVYEELVSLVEEGFAIITPADEVARCLAGQAAPMRRAMLALLPHVSDMRDKKRGQGPRPEGNRGGALRD